MLIKKFPTISGSYRENVCMANMTWFNVGGKADILLKPNNTNDLISIIKEVKLPIHVIGVGSNLIVRDSGIKGIVIKLGRHFNKISCNDNIITVGCSVLLRNLAKFALDNKISGFEFLIGIPGTVGGSLEMNAGSYGYDISCILQSIKAINSFGEIHWLTKKDMGYHYRGNNLKDNWIFLEAVFSGVRSTQNLIFDRMSDYLSKRNESQPVKGKTGGSTFKNPDGHKAWKLIKDSGCSDLKYGGAKVSEKHCNFLLNYSNATASDLENLGKEIIKKVQNKFNITLEWEIKFLG